MTAVIDPPAAAPSPPAGSSPTPTEPIRARRLGMRWKLLLAFGLGFTVVFVAVAAWILQFSTNTANERVKSTLRGISEGGATTIDPVAFTELIAADPQIVPGEVYPADAGYLAGTVVDENSQYPASPLYWRHVNELADIKRTNPESSPYSYYRAPDGVLVFVGSWGALGYPTIGVDPPDGGKFLQPISEFVGDGETYTLFTRGLDELTEQPAYTDTLGSWISVYTPIPALTGDAAIGVDYPLAYVDQVRSDVVRVLYPVFGVAYLVLIGLVVYLSAWLTRRLGRLSAATKRVSEGDYEVDLATAAHARFADEMTELADSFIVMTSKVETRERKLVQQVKILKVEIDEVKRKEAVAEITDSDFFNSLTAKADQLRAKVKAADAAGTGTGTGTGLTSGESPHDD